MMLQRDPPAPSSDNGQPITETSWTDFLPALGELAKARDFARDCEQEVWQFAVNIEPLTRLGVSVSDLRWLICKGVLQHAHETKRRESPARVFRASHSLAFGKSTCFVLTAKGQRFLQSLVAGSRDINHTLAGLLQSQRQAALPRWNGVRRELRAGEYLVKRFRCPAPNQEAVLDAFQEEDWPEAGVFDPLPPNPDKHPKQRLRDTIKCLNRHQECAFIRFHGDGSGERIRWEYTEEAVSVLGSRSKVSACSDEVSQRAG